MKKILILSICSIFIVAAQFKDSDLDGIADKVDKCPNTPFNAIVDENGCPVKYLDMKVSNVSYDLYTELSYLKDKGDEESSSLFYFGVFKDSYYFSVSSLLNDLSGSQKLSDITVKAKKYINFTDDLYSSVGFSLKIPVRDQGTNKIDIPLYFSLNYSIKNSTVYMGGSYTFVNDKSSYYDYKNSNSFYSGLSFNYYLYSLNISYMIQKDKYDDISRSIGLGIIYSPKKSSFYYNLSYVGGLNSNAIDHIYSFGIGINF